MENMIFDWMSSQSWWGIFATVVVAANAVTMTLKDRYAENIPFIGKIWPILNWLSLNVGKNKNDEATNSLPHSEE